MSDCSVIQHQCTTASEVMDRARLTIERRRASMRRIPPVKRRSIAEIAAAAPPLELPPNNCTYLIRDIQKSVCAAADISLAEMLSSRREHRLVLPRHVAIIMCLLLTTKSTAYIGHKFGGRDHTSVIHPRNKMHALSDLLRPILEDAPLNYIAAIALVFARKNYAPPSPHQKAIRNPDGKFSANS